MKEKSILRLISPEVCSVLLMIVGVLMVLFFSYNIIFSLLIMNVLYGLMNMMFYRIVKKGSVVLYKRTISRINYIREEISKWEEERVSESWQEIQDGLKKEFLSVKSTCRFTFCIAASLILLFFVVRIVLTIQVMDNPVSFITSMFPTFSIVLFLYLFVNMLGIIETNRIVNQVVEKVSRW